MTLHPDETHLSDWNADSLCSEVRVGRWSFGDRHDLSRWSLDEGCSLEILVSMPLTVRQILQDLDGLPECTPS